MIRSAPLSVEQTPAGKKGSRMTFSWAVNSVRLGPDPQKGSSVHCGCVVRARCGRSKAHHLVNKHGSHLTLIRFNLYCPYPSDINEMNSKFNQMFVFFRVYK